MKKLLTALALTIITAPIISTTGSDMAFAEKSAMVKKNKGYGSRSRAYFKKMDKNNDGVVSKAEFIEFKTQKFEKKDANKDGKLSPEEFSKRLAKKEKKNNKK